MKTNNTDYQSTRVDFDPIAHSYNQLYSEITYADQTELILNKLILPAVAPGAPMLDLCCGTGHVDARLSMSGMKVLGIDSSREMLRCARRNSPTSVYVCADARRFSVPGVHDAAISLSDSMHTILDLEALVSVFRNTQASLSDRGFFVFDMTTEFGFMHCRREELTLIKSDVVLALRFRFDLSRKLGTTLVSASHFQEGTWQRSDGTIFERSYSADEVCGALADAGFSEVELFDAPTADGEVGKIIFRAWKTGDNWNRKQRHNKEDL